MYKVGALETLEKLKHYLTTSLSVLATSFFDEPKNQTMIPCARHSHSLWKRKGKSTQTLRKRNTRLISDVNLQCFQNKRTLEVQREHSGAQFRIKVVK